MTSDVCLRPSVLGHDRSETKKIGLGLGLVGLVLFCEKRSCHARRHNDLEGHSNFSSTVYSFCILCFEHHYCGDQQRRSLTQNLNPPSAFVYFRWSWSSEFGLVYIIDKHDDEIGTRWMTKSSVESWGKASAKNLEDGCPR